MTRIVDFLGLVAVFAALTGKAGRVFDLIFLATKRLDLKCSGFGVLKMAA